MTTRTIRQRLGCPELTHHGRTFPSGLSVFTTMIGNHLASFRTDRRGRDAIRSAREYFTQIKKDGT